MQELAGDGHGQGQGRAGDRGRRGSVLPLRSSPANTSWSYLVEIDYK